MTQVDTVTRILDAAEALFAERGFAETSLRSITTRADVNLAAVNYHFGSKKALIQAVFSRFLGPFYKLVEASLDNHEKTQPDTVLSIEDILHFVAHAMTAVSKGDRSKLTIFMRLLGLAYNQGQGHLRKFLQREYRSLFRRVMALVTKATPDLDPMERFWRFHFMLGSAAFTLSSMEHLMAIVEDDLSIKCTEEDVVGYLLPFLAAGIRAK
ncbi:transcriptional regulator PsrA [Oceaniserpentilla sp. 4NH20-0058]|uniref:TetR/AcrR family transcriptional regulator n=1 Tax=Oceaniserpentilla sp. 4NH20-0058 TaxID=3127660 RepID=UPI00310BEA1D